MAVTRTVRYLRLRAATEAQVRRAALCLEDALRTAGLPDGGGRLLLVRRLALGRIAADATPQTLALRIEQAVEAQGVECLHGGDATAGVASVVWFRDMLDAHTCAALRLAEGRPLAEWYWPLALPVLRTVQGLLETLRALAFSLAARPEASAALPHWAAALTRAGHAGVLLAALRPGDGAFLLRVCGDSMADQRNPDVPKPMPGSSPRDPPTDAVPNGLRWEDDRVVWLRKMFLREAPESLSGNPLSLRERVRVRGDNAPFLQCEPRQSSPLQGEREQFLQAALDQVVPIAFRSDEHSDDAGTSGPVPAAHREEVGHRDPGAVSVPLRGRQPEDERLHTAERALPHRLTGWPHAPPTAAGGLLFLLPVLGRLCHAEWLEAHPAWARAGIISRILKLLLARLRVNCDDPAWSLATSLTATRSRAPSTFTASTGLLALAQHGRPWRLAGTRLYDGSGRLLLAAWRRMPSRGGRALLSLAPLIAAPRIDGALIDSVAEAWVTACRRWLRRIAGIGLADLVLRPAGLTATPTHIDLYFDLRATDLRVRRAGLDLDPGWVPWLGRVVTFHYTDRLPSVPATRGVRVPDGC